MKKGEIMSAEMKAKLSKAHMGKTISMEHRLAISLGGKGRKRSEETRARMRIAQKGRFVSQQARQRIGDSLRGKPGRNTGNKHSEETKLRISLAKLGKPSVNRGKKNLNITGEKHWAWKGGINQVIARRARLRGALGLHTKEQWEELKKKYNYMCLCCKKQEPFIKLTEDHIVPLIMGGSNYIINIQPLCMPCNARKHTKTIDYSLSLSSI